ncbi:MAG: hypothetical protein JWM96_606 [Alphaproteobacteria bacterium]|nr:hypothetical protein [Alphaproteobacteria bacterium]
MKSSSESGFTLVEIAVVVLIIGILMGGAVSMLTPYLQMAKRSTTQTKLENISQSLAFYAQNYGRLPCPTNPNSNDTSNPPFGAPRNSGTNGTVVGNVCDSGTLTTDDYIGIVPFRALGLTEDQVKDSYGRFITYAVSPVLTKYNPDPNSSPPPGTPADVHDQCRTAIWINSQVTANIAVKKSEVCCANRATTTEPDIRIMSARTGGTSLFSGRKYDGVPPSNSYGSPLTLQSGTPGVDTRFVAFALVSHGPDGDGAFMGRSANRMPSSIATAATTEESGNADTTDLDLVSRPLSTTENAGYFDDILAWRTNDQLISAFGNDSCARPVMNQ